MRVSGWRPERASVAIVTCAVYGATLEKKILTLVQGIMQLIFVNFSVVLCVLKNNSERFILTSHYAVCFLESRTFILTCAEERKCRCIHTVSFLWIKAE